jgi:hypothetical protein
VDGTKERRPWGEGVDRSGVEDEDQKALSCNWWRSAVRKIEFLLGRREETMELVKVIDYLSSVMEASREMVWYEAEDVSISQRVAMLTDRGSNDFPNLKL